jgi:hypothetical protein
VTIPKTNASDKRAPPIPFPKFFIIVDVSLTGEQWQPLCPAGHETGSSDLQALED